VSTPPSNRRPGPPARPGQADRARRREPLFPLEDDDISPRRRPPQPLADLVSDLDDAMAPRGRGAPRSAPRPEEPPPPPLPPRLAGQPERRAEAQPPRKGTVDLAVREQRPQPQLRAAPRTDKLPTDSGRLLTARAAYDEAEADLLRAEHYARPYGGVPRPAPAIELPSWTMLLVVAAASLLVLMTLGNAGGGNALSRWAPALFTSEEVAPVASELAGPANPAGDYRLEGAPSISAETIDRILASYGSPAAGTGAVWYNLGLRYGIDPAFAVAFFIHESTAGTAQNWAGLKPDGSTTHNVGNIICAGYATCYNRFRDYPSWEAGIDDWYRLIDVEYIEGRGHQTVGDIIPIYAPAFENNVQLYVDTVNGLVDTWRRGEVP